MPKAKTDPVRTRPWWSIFLAVAVLIAVAIAALAYQSNRTGRDWWQMLAGSDTPAPPAAAGGSILPQQPQIDCFTSRPIGAPLEEGPKITNVDVADLDGDGLLDVLVCDALQHRVSWIRQHPRGTFTEHVCAPQDGPIKAPAHVQAFDVDNDGDQDILVASVGQLFPTNDKVGSVVILENDGAMSFNKRVLGEDLMRVADVRGGDLDGDGDVDLAVAMFGAIEGGTCWMENKGDWRFVTRDLQSLSGPINCPIVDIDKDGDLDIAVLVSQEWEEIHLFLNDGAGRFTPKLIWGSGNEDFGSGQIRVVDLDLDGDIDFLYTNGDSWDYYPPRPRPWHGVHWLENRGDLRFVMHRMVTFEGPYSALPMDVDLDKDLDVLVTSMFNDWEDPDARSVIWLQNNGSMQFARRDIASAPTHIQTSAAGDFDGDGLTDFVTGGVYTDPPHDRKARVLLWTNQWKGAIDASWDSR